MSTEENKNSIPMLIAGVAILFFGVNLLFRGNIWTIVLGDERYFVSVLPICLGVYLVYISIKRLIKGHIQ